MKHGWLYQATSQHCQQWPKAYETTQLSTKGTSQKANYRNPVHLRHIPPDFQLSHQRAQVSHRSCLISDSPISHLSYLRASHMAQENCAQAIESSPKYQKTARKQQKILNHQLIPLCIANSHLPQHFNFPSSSCHSGKNETRQGQGTCLSTLFSFPNKFFM